MYHYGADAAHCRLVNADSDEAAEEKALEIYHNTPAKDFEAGDDERDCTLYNKDTGKMVFDWG